MNPTLKKAAFLYPVLLLLLAALALAQIPKENFLSPRPLNYKSRYENFYNPELPYVTVSVPELYSTGLQYEVNELPRGNYYYTLHDGFCQFYLLSGAGKTAEPILEASELKGRLIRLEDAEYEQLLTCLAEELSWSKDSLREVTSPYAVSALPDFFLFHQFFRILSFGCLIFSAADLCRISLHSANKKRDRC